MARAVHAEMEVSDEDSGTESELVELAFPDTNKPVTELGPSELMAQVFQAQTQMYHALMRVMETLAKVQEQGTRQGEQKLYRGKRRDVMGA